MGTIAPPEGKQKSIVLLLLSCSYGYAHSNEWDVTVTVAWDLSPPPFFWGGGGRVEVLSRSMPVPICEDLFFGGGDSQDSSPPPPPQKKPIAPTPF